jgi:CDP-paratose 2-epimerase
LHQILAYISDYVGRAPAIDMADWRAGDQRYFVADTRALQSAIDLRPRKPWRQGVADLADWLVVERQERAELSVAPMAARAL